MEPFAEELGARGYPSSPVEVPRDNPSATFDDDARIIADAIAAIRAKNENARIIGIFWSRAGNYVGRLAAMGAIDGAVHLACSYEPSTLYGRMSEKQVEELPPRNNADFIPAIDKVDGGLSMINPKFASEYLYRYCSEDTISWAVPQLTPQVRGDQGSILLHWPRIPELYLAGEGDPIITPEWQLAVTGPNALDIPIEFIENGGHALHLAQAGKVAGRITRWAVETSDDPTERLPDTRSLYTEEHGDGYDPAYQPPRQRTVQPEGAQDHSPE